MYVEEILALQFRIPYHLEVIKRQEPSLEKSEQHLPTLPAAFVSETTV